MSRTTLRQKEQILNSESYDDQQEIILTEISTFEHEPGVSFDLEDDLNQIRTQLKRLNDPNNGGTTNWHDDPILPIGAFFHSSSAAIPAGEEVDVGGAFDAGEPYDLNVYLNGELLTPSSISGGSITTERDYQEIDENGANVGTGSVGRKIRLNFDLISGDILQFVWTA